MAGIVFMGTPHSGANIAFWGSIAGKLLSMASLGTRTNKDLLSVLQTDSKFLGSVSEGFAWRNWELPILSFYELEKMPLLNCRVSIYGSRSPHGLCTSLSVLLVWNRSWKRLLLRSIFQTSLSCPSRPTTAPYVASDFQLPRSTRRLKML